MHFTCTLVAAIACITTVCNAIYLNLWTDGGCGGSASRCINAGYADCCTGGNPFCMSDNCDGCVVGNDSYTFNKNGCSRNSFGSCRAAVGNGCCLGAGGGIICAVIAYVGNARKRDVDPEECEATIMT